MDKKYVCPCGLVCSDCLFRKPEIYETARRLRDEIRNSQLDVFLSMIAGSDAWKAIAAHLGANEAEFGRHFAPFRNLPGFMDMLDALIKLQCTATCRESGGCSMGGTTHQCEAVQCVAAKGYEGCWECADSSGCAKLLFVRKSYGESIENTFKVLRENGADALKPYGDRYYAWQRKMNG
ncbi:Protein of unknown function DUF3795 [Desulfovibrio sp. X2]|uniref:DUF3795 domain-containing protein n=1 Tax=Desulfovibrio sp. X2 TaxID=941449 RepID=UPI000358901E|nr:DUF3795 domain-containing protein [Desulfovibrio sp. X2]EPR44475.1 Protein of unknown function DUF3795 [Desulfovibrio sp. X2]